MGGGLGFQLAINYPKRVKRLILLAPIPSSGYKADKDFVRKRNIFRLNKNIPLLRKIIKKAKNCFSQKKRIAGFFKEPK